jgi:hypothetical protein
MLLSLSNIEDVSYFNEEKKEAIFLLNIFLQSFIKKGFFNCLVYSVSETIINSSGILINSINDFLHLLKTFCSVRSSSDTCNNCLI